LKSKAGNSLEIITGGDSETIAGPVHPMTNVDMVTGAILTCIGRMALKVSRGVARRIWKKRIVAVGAPICHSGAIPYVV